MTDQSELSWLPDFYFECGLNNCKTRQQQSCLDKLVTSCWKLTVFLVSDCCNIAWRINDNLVRLCILRYCDIFSLYCCTTWLRHDPDLALTLLSVKVLSLMYNSSRQWKCFVKKQSDLVQRVNMELSTRSGSGTTHDHSWRMGLDLQISTPWNYRSFLEKSCRTFHKESRLTIGLQLCWYIHGIPAETQFDMNSIRDTSFDWSIEISTVNIVQHFRETSLDDQILVSLLLSKTNLAWNIY